MPEITVIHIVIIATALILGLIIAWFVRGRRSDGEKAAINLGWQEQLEAQRAEHDRLLDQNKSLMDQNSQYQASNKDAKMRASELSAALKEAFERRDELQRQIKDIRSNLEATVAERNQLASDMQNREVEDDVVSTALKQRDDTIERLKRELEGWQARVPPLIERFRERNERALQLEQELAAAHDRIEALEAMLGSEQTRVEPVDRQALGEDLDASNDGDEDAAVEATDDTLNEVVEEASDDAADLGDLLDVDEMVEEDDKADIAPFSAHRDDLKKIKGVGPAIEKTLNEMGICRFDQIADMSEYEIDRIAQRLKGFRSRIYREDWIGQARELQDQYLNGQA